MPTLTEFCSKGIEKALLYLYDEQKKIADGDRTDSVSASELSKECHVSVGTLYPVVLKKLKESDLVIQNQDGKYTITPKGRIFVETVIRDSRLILGFNEKMERTEISNSDLANEAQHVGSNARSELLLTARNLTSLEDSEVSNVVEPTFATLKKRNVRVRILLDPHSPPETETRCITQWGAKVKFMPSSFLAHLPGILNPIELNDFSHVLIADEYSWLYLKQHTDEKDHKGMRSFKDPTMGAYLASIFRTLWSIASSDRDAALYFENLVREIE